MSAERAQRTSMDAAHHKVLSPEQQTDGLGLFATPAPAPKDVGPRKRTSDTSLSAEAKERGQRMFHRELCRQAIREAGPDGITRLEIAAKTTLLRDTVNGRCREILDDTSEGVVTEGRRNNEGVLIEIGYLGGRA